MRRSLLYKRYTMSTFMNLTDAAKAIKISRQALYPWLERYPPIIIGGHPVLSADQIKAIKAERKLRHNGTRKAA